MESPVGPTLKSVVERSLRKYKDRDALQVDTESYTYSQLDSQSNQIAAALVDAGVGPSDRVALSIRNSFEYAVARFAIIKAGAAVVPIHVDLTADEIEYMLEDSRSSILLCEDRVYGTIAEADLPHLEDCIVVYRDEGSTADASTPFDQVLARGTAADPPDVPVSPSDIVGHHFTGGTTGKPKGVLFTHESRLKHLYAHFIELDISSDDTLLINTPVAHVARLYLKAAWMIGARVVLQPEFDVEATATAIEEEHITWTFMVPTMIYRLLDYDKDHETDFASLRTLVYGGAPINPDRAEEAIDVFGPTLIQLYGQTEIPSLVTTLGKQEHIRGYRDEDSNILQSAGQPCVMTDVRIVDMETGDLLEAGEIGEIVATAEYTMKEYFERPQETTSALENGWVHTGDIGRIEGGYLYILDRDSNVVVTGGMNVFTLEVEDVILEHPDVSDAAVFGVPDDEWGEAVIAAIVPAGDGSATGDDIIEFLQGRVAAYKKPKHVSVRAELPTTAYGKIDKNALKDEYWTDSDRNVH